MVAYLQDGVVDDEQLAKSAERPKPTALPISHEAAFKWFYKDPQGEIQGEQSSVEHTVVSISPQPLQLELRLPRVPAR